ncbi:thiopeptide-type bacteriocin biosynthesis protein [Actinomadura oligospora]|uniref:thiopeptide-type bacteriocin biosynthesis protein n=1 Tax=Actinomadura oligospora TaxID=111804 RepID=UPI00047BFEC9|nr:thiopeptide-type bacteriocin biosynthesis protein [Actinomadura oligospora]
MSRLTDVLEPLDENPDEGDRWLEVRLLIGTDPATGGPRVPWKRLGEAITRWRAEQRFELCFFVRKYPGLRLRFHGPDLETRLAPELLPWIGDETERGELVGHRLAVYEPEFHRFGGPAGMAVAHRHWNRDTLLALAYEATRPTAPASVGASGLWAAMVNHLLRLCLEDAAEAWDVWKRLDTLVAAVDSAADSPPEGITPGLAQELYRLSPDLLARLVPAEIRLLREAVLSNQQTAHELRALDFDGALTVGKRSWLTANATFQCNRWGLGLRPADLRSVTKAMTSLLQPDLQGVHSPETCGFTR